MHMQHQFNLIATGLLIQNARCQPGSGSGNGPSNIDTDYEYCNTDVGDDAWYNETISADSSAYNGYVRHVEMSGCPNYPTSPVKYDTLAAVIDRVVDIPAYPCFNDADYDLLCESAGIGVTLNGILIFSRFQNINSCPENNDAVQDEGDDFDECGGHPSDAAAGGEEYHYHNLPSCLADQLGDYDDVTSHSPQYGWAYDGFPIYGPHTVNGAEIYLCTHDDADPDYCLDECGGTDQYEIDGFLYHYHIQGPLSDLTTIPLNPLPTQDRSPYTLGCFKGVPSEINTGGSCQSDGFNSTYTPKTLEGVTEVYVRANSSVNATTASPTEPTADPTRISTNQPSDSGATRDSTDGNAAGRAMSVALSFTITCLIAVAAN